MNSIDLMGFGAHPDDVELFAGGLFLKMSSKNYQSIIVDLTKGGAATRGNASLREQETENANKLLKLKERINLDFPDAGLSIIPEARQEIAKIIRKYRPKIIVAPYWKDRHPDHSYTSQLVTEAVHVAGLPEIKLDNSHHKAWKPNIILYTPYHEVLRVNPSFLVDISEWMQAKQELIKSYSSQFFNPNSQEPETMISRASFIPALEARARLYGEMINVEFAEGYIVKKPIAIDDPVLYFTT